MTVRLLVVALALVLAGCGSADSDTRPSPEPSPTSGSTRAACPDLVMVGVRGQNQSPDANGGLGTELRLLTTALTQQVQRGGTTVRRESIDYDSDPAPELDAYDTAVSAGAARLSERLDALERRCGDDTDVAVLGFSMGAQVVHTAMHDRRDDRVAAVVMIADPRRDPGATHVDDTFDTSAPRPGSLGAGPAFTDLADRTVAFCVADDDVCNHPPGTSRTDTNQVHKHYYEKRSAVAHMAAVVDRLIADP